MLILTKIIKIKASVKHKYLMFAQERAANFFTVFLEYIKEHFLGISRLFHPVPSDIIHYYGEIIEKMDLFQKFSSKSVKNEKMHLDEKQKLFITLQNIQFFLPN